MKTIKALIMCIQFFTSIPVPYEVPMDREHMERAIRVFPILGILQGIIYIFITFALLEWTPLSTVAVAFFLWLSWIIVTGGLHLDGWMDVSDGYFSFRNPEKRLEIMKDSRIGAFGVLSVLVLLSARFLFIYETISRMSLWTYPLILLIPFFGKIMMGVLLIKVKSAKADGLGAMFQQAASKGTLWRYPVYLIVLLGMILFIWPESFWGLASFIIGSSLFILIARKKIIRWFGGITGDVLGAAVEGGETLLWLILWLLPYVGLA